MKTKILVANRGEIAIRIIRAIQELNYEAVAIYETPDRDSMHIRSADEANRIHLYIEANPAQWDTDDENPSNNRG